MAAQVTRSDQAWASGGALGHRPNRYGSRNRGCSKVVGMAYDVARVRGLHPSLGDGWVHFDAQHGMLLPDSVATTVSTAFRGSMITAEGPHPSAQRGAAVLVAARQAVADLVGGYEAGVVLGADRAILLASLADASASRVGL